MKRGETYRIKRPTAQDPKRFRFYVVVSRQNFIETAYETVICAPVYTNRNGLLTEVDLGIEDGLKHDSAVRCDEFLSIQKFKLTNFVGSLSKEKIKELNQALKTALEIND